VEPDRGEEAVGVCLRIELVRALRRLVEHGELGGIRASALVEVRRRGRLGLLVAAGTATRAAAGTATGAGLLRRCVLAAAATTGRAAAT
jgi:hypothetical protein